MSSSSETPSQQVSKTASKTASKTGTGEHQALLHSSLRPAILALYASFFIALISTLGSLIFSEVMGYPPCVLCWYQRICMYPLIAIFASAIWTDDRRGYLKYSLPLIVIGFGIALYHNGLYYGFIPDHIKPCEQGVSCTSRHIQWLGFITIPFLSLTGFTLLLMSHAWSVFSSRATISTRVAQDQFAKGKDSV